MRTMLLFMIVSIMAFLLSPPVTAQRSTDIIWDTTINRQTPLGAAISDQGDRIFTAVGYKPAKACLFDAWGAGNPLWIYGIQPFVIEGDFTMSEDGSIKVLVYTDLTDECTGIYKWSGDNPEPDWHYEFTGTQYFAYGGVSADGSTIVAISSSVIKLHYAVFDPASGIPTWTKDEFVGIGTVEAVVLSGDGNVALANDMGRAWAFETSAGIKLWEGYGAVARGYDLSWDGTYMVATIGDMPGSVEVRHWNGAGYELLWDFVMPGAPDAFSDAAAISDDGSTVLLGLTDWSRRGHNWLGIFDISSPVPLWSREIEGGPGGGFFIYDVIAHCDLSADGSRAIVGYWGDPEYPHEELFIFERENPDPIFVIDTPGSIFGCDLTADGTQAAVACKRIHASQSGYGGTVYSIDLTTGAILTVTESPSGPVFAGESFTVGLKLENTGSAAQRFNELELLVSGPVSGELDLYAGSHMSIPPGATIEKSFEIIVPGATPPGEYEGEPVLRLDGGWLCRDSFTFEVQ